MNTKPHNFILNLSFVLTALTILMFVVSSSFSTLFVPHEKGKLFNTAYGQMTTSDIQNLSDDPKYSFNQKISAVNGDAYIVWESQDNTSTQHIMFTKSIDGGPFAQVIDLSPTDAYAHGVQIAAVPDIANINNTIVYVAWMSLGNDRHDAVMRISNDSGSTFSDPINLSSNDPHPFDISLAASENFVYVGWRAYPPSQADEIYVRASNDTGNSFGNTTNLSQSSGGSGYLQIAATTGGIAYFTWYDSGDIVFRATFDGGSTFTGLTTLSDDISNGEESWMQPNDAPQVSAFGNNVHVVWQIYGTGVFLRSSTDGGNSFNDVILISNNEPQYPFSPSLATRPNAEINNIDDLSIAWYDDTLGEYQIFVRSSFDGGSNFDSSINVSNNTGASVLPKIVISEQTGNAYVLWKDSADGLLMKVKLNNDSFSDPININNRSTLLDNYPLSLAVSDGKVYIVWTDFANGSGDILFRQYDENIFDANSQPVANAGSDQIVDEGSSNVVTLDGSGSTDPDGDALEYFWVQTGGNHNVLLSNNDNVVATFVSPEVYAPEDVLTFQLLVSDGRGATHADTAQVTINDLGDHALTEEARISIGIHPSDIAVNTLTNMIYVSTDSAEDNYDYYYEPPGGAVSVIDGSTYSVVSTIPTGYGALGLAVNENTDRVYVANYGSGAWDFPSTISVIDGSTNSLISTIPADPFTYDVAVNPDTNVVYAVGGGTDSVTVLDGYTNELVAKVSVGDLPARLSVNPTTNLIYVSNAGDNSISVINGTNNEILTTIMLQDSPRAIEVNTITNMIYVLGSSTQDLYVINGTSNNLTSILSVPYSPQGITINQLSNTIYVVSASSDGDNLTIIDGNSDTITEQISISPFPSSVALNPATDKLYVSNIGDGTVSVIHLGSSATHESTAQETRLIIESWDRNARWGQTITISGRLINDNDEGIPGKTIAFTGTGVLDFESVVTNSDGSFNVTGTAPSVVASGWTVRAIFSGDEQYQSDRSAIKYRTTPHPTGLVLKILPTSTFESGTNDTFKVVAILEDKITDSIIDSRLISFTSDSPLSIPDRETNALGKAIISKLLVPHEPGLYNIQAHFAGDDLYAAKDSKVKTLIVS